MTHALAFSFFLVGVATLFMARFVLKAIAAAKKEAARDAEALKVKSLVSNHRDARGDAS